MLRHWGYKSVFIFGLCVFGVGALMMLAKLSRPQAHENTAKRVQVASWRLPFVRRILWCDFHMWQRTGVSRNSRQPISFSLWPSSILRTSHQLCPSLQRHRDGRWACAWLVRLVGIPFSTILCHFEHDFDGFVNVSDRINF